MSQNNLTKPSNCTRTQHEQKSRSFDPRGAGGEDGGGVGCWERWRVGTSCCAGKKRVACAFSNPAEQKKSHWTVPAPALLSPLMQPSVKAPQQSSPSPGTESRILLAPAKSHANCRSLSIARSADSGPSRHPLVFGRLPGVAGYTAYLAPATSRRENLGYRIAFRHKPTTDLR